MDNRGTFHNGRIGRPPCTVADLAAVVRGTVVTPDDPGWDEARLAWNLAVDQRPALVALPADAADVRAIVEFARRDGLRVAAQGTGHNAGALTGLGDAILLSTRRMKGVQIDAGRRIARVQAGTLAGELAEAATKDGLFPLLGSSPDVGVVGYTLGGGVSWLGRTHGLAANHVVSVEVVTPTGALVRATPSERPELFWALRGGGGNFGVVTALELALLPRQEVYAGMFLWPYERHAEVLDAWHELTRRAPEELTTSFRILHMPPLDELPPFLAGRSIVVVDGAFAGGPSAGRAALEGLQHLAPEMDTWAPTPPAALSHLHLDPEQPTPFLSDAMLLHDLDEAGRRAFESALPPTPGLLFGELRHLGGGFARAPENAGAVGSLAGEYLLVGIGVLPAPEVAPAIEASLADLRRALAPYDTGRAYANFADRPVDPATLFSAESYARLQTLRADVDPENLMVAAHPIPPAPNAA
jgi:UDP-N-acetylenolpyruvoylglucosamine reductase